MNSNILDTTHNLFATEDTTVSRLWGTSSFVVDGPTPACVMLVAPEYVGRSPWFLVKSQLVNFARNLEPTPPERDLYSFSLEFKDKENTVNFCVDKTIYQLRFLSPGPYWCFKGLSKGNEHADWHRGCDLDESILLNAISTFTIPGEVPPGMRGPETRTLGLDNAAGKGKARAVSADMSPAYFAGNLSTPNVGNTFAPNVGTSSTFDVAADTLPSASTVVQPPSDDLPDLLYPNDHAPAPFSTSTGNSDLTTEVRVKVEEVEPTLSFLESDTPVTSTTNLPLTTPGAALTLTSMLRMPSPGRFIACLNHFGPQSSNTLQSVHASGSSLTSFTPVGTSTQLSRTTTAMALASARMPSPSFPGRLIDFLARLRSSEFPSILQSHDRDQQGTRNRKRHGQWPEMRAKKRLRF